MIGGFCIIKDAQAGASDNLSGWVWSSNIGWISFNSTNCDIDGDNQYEGANEGGGATPAPTDCPTSGAVQDYGVNVDRTTGMFSGFAWSSNIGSINFAPAGIYPTSPNYSACLDLPGAGQDCDGVGDYNVSGWARACSAFQNPTLCSGALNPNAGGWEGWIKLRGFVDANQNGVQEITEEDYGVYLNDSTNEFHEWAFGGDPEGDDGEAVIGWVSFNHLNCDPDNDGVSEGGAGCPPAGTSISDYKVILANNPPVASIGCDGSGCLGGSCVTSPWRAVRAITCTPVCIFTLTNNSTDPDGQSDIENSIWTIKKIGGTTPIQTSDCIAVSGNPLCSYTISSVLTAPDAYTTELYVTDGKVSDIDTADFELCRCPVADFMCSLDPVEPRTWEDCGTISINVGDTLYLIDDPSLAKHSSPSDCPFTVTSIVQRVWSFNGSDFDSGNNSAPSIILGATGTFPLRLAITDNIGQSNSQTYNLNVGVTPTPPLPEWKEIPPSGWQRIKNFFANIFNFFKEFFLI